MRSAFRKISRVGSLTGGTRWYLSDDCLLAAKRVMYAVEYRRFYLRDIESVVVWPTRAWILRAGIPGMLLGAVGITLGSEVNVTAGAIFCGVGLGWAGLELVLGPTAKSRIRTTGTSVDLPLVKRARRAHKVLSKIDAAVRAARGGVTEQPATRTDDPQQGESTRSVSSGPAPAAAAIGPLTQTDAP